LLVHTYATTVVKLGAGDESPIAGTLKLWVGRLDRLDAGPSTGTLKLSVGSPIAGILKLWVGKLEELGDGSPIAGTEKRGVVVGSPIAGTVIRGVVVVVVDVLVSPFAVKMAPSSSPHVGMPTTSLQAALQDTNSVYKAIKAMKLAYCRVKEDGEIQVPIQRRRPCTSGRCSVVSSF